MTIAHTRHHRSIGLCALGALWGFILGGCAKPTVNIPAGVAVAGYDETAKQAQADPVAFLRHSLDESRKLKSFTTQFQRQERLGLFRELKKQENMIVEFREVPFSVRFTWQDDDSDFTQAVFVKGRYDDKVRLMPRKGAMGQPPQVQAYPVSFAVIFQRSRSPVTDFGPRRMMERIIDRIERAEKGGGKVQFTLKPPAEIGPAKDPCIHLELRYPPNDPHACKLQDLYIHARTHVPVATYLWLPGKNERCADTLDAMYVYGGLNPSVQLTDATFEITARREQADGTEPAVRTVGDLGTPAPRPAP